jgi:Phage integrase family
VAQLVRPPLRFHDLRHTFASHLIIDLGLDIAQVSRILGHASITITLDIYAHLFEDARHAHDIRTRMAASPFAGLLEPTTRARRHGAQAPIAGGNATTGALRTLAQHPRARSRPLGP